MMSRDALQPLPYVSAFSQWLESHLASDDEAALLAYREQTPRPRARTHGGALPAVVRGARRGRDRCEVEPDLRRNGRRGAVDGRLPLR